MKKCILATVLVATLLSSCSSAPTSKAEYLSDYDRLEKGARLEAFWFDSSYVPTPGALPLRLTAISSESVSDAETVSVADVKNWSREDLRTLDLISRKPADDSLNLELAITIMDPGSASARIWAGEFGAGHAYLQIEGKLRDPVSGQVIAAFAEQRRSSGAIGLKDVGGDAGATLVREMVVLITEDIDAELRQSIASASLSAQ